MRAAVAQLFNKPRALLVRATQIVGLSPAPASDLKVDVYTTSEEIVVVASIPGLKPEDVEIRLEDDRLTIGGTYPPPIPNVEYVMGERERGHFSRTLALNVPVDGHRASAKIQDGLLILALPKNQEASSKVIRVPAKAQS